MMAKTLSSNTFTYVKKCNIYTLLHFFARNPKGDLHGYIWLRFAQSTLIESKIQNLHP